MSIQKTKLGARFLSDSEMGAILPDWKSITSQIEVFRHDRSVQKSGQQEYEQKTNHIGIMGRRGAGKTSILRTFHKKLKEGKSCNDIVLPIIIPENMSSGTSLMDVVLGMMKPLVDEESKAAPQGDCIYLNRGKLEQAYHKLVKQYCYIKKDYRDILIHQFTSEQYYVDKTTKVFSSDTVFIEQFSKFIDLLLDRDWNKEGTSEAMLFLFIDDIDLSTIRCMDVVKTLLSYLSHPRIVTFLSGDLNTFEEALTLEFLRQEKALDADVFLKAYGPARNGRSSELSKAEEEEHSLREQKKELAYEYLKKILPPAYRKNIKYWSLEERGNYRVADEEGKEQKTLAELLGEVTAGKMERSCFDADRGEGKTHGIHVMYHLFDETSRGLNNVYNVLLELCGKEKGTDNSQQEEDAEKMGLWRLLRAVIDSSPFYAKYKETLLKNVIVQIGQGAQVDFLSLKNLLYYGGDLRFSAVDGFRLFLLAEFAAGLFSKESREELNYQELKLKILAEYIRSEEIDGKIAAERPLPDLKTKDKTDQEKKEPWVLKRLLQCGSFLFGLNLIQYLGREAVYDILNVDAKTSAGSPKENRFYKIAVALKKTIWTICVEGKDHRQECGRYLAELYLQAEDALLELLNHLPYHQNVIYGEWLIRDLILRGMRYRDYDSDNVAIAYLGEAEGCLDSIKKYLSESHKYVPAQGVRNDIFIGNWHWAEYTGRCSLYGLYFESCLRENDKYSKIYFNIGRMAKELMYAGMAKTLGNLIEGIEKDNQVQALEGFVYESVQGKEDEKQRQVVVEIDKAGIWNHSYTKEKVFPYLKRKTEGCIEKISGGRMVFDASQLIRGAYAALRDCNKGTSGKALALGLVERLETILFLSEADHHLDSSWYMRLEHVLVIRCMLEEFLLRHPRVRYGKQEARKFLMELKELPLVIRTENWDQIQEELKAREERFFYKDEPQAEELPLQEKEQQAKELPALQEWKRLRYDIAKKDEVINVLKKQNKMEGLDGLVDDVYQNYYLGEDTKFGGKDPIEAWIKKYMENTYHEKVQSFTYIEYLVQQKAIHELEKNLQINPEALKKAWSRVEPIPAKEDYMFYFYSYLRCLLANDLQAEEMGRDAQEIKTLVDSLLESEVLADRMRQNDVFELVSKKLGITEAEFEELF